MGSVKRFFVIFFCVIGTLAWGQIPSGDNFLTPSRPAGASTAPTISANVADIKNDTEATRKDVKDLTLRVEQLERDNAALEAKLSKNADTTSFVTRDEMKLLEIRMNEAVTAEGKRVEGVILEDIKAAKNSAAAKAKADGSAGAETGTKKESAANVSKTPDASAASTKAGKSASKTAASAASVSAAPVSASEKESYMKEGVRYTVQPGDTLSSIAKKYHSTVRAIMAVNEIATPNKLYVGRELFVPTL
jgi:LysM repeat protein